MSLANALALADQGFYVFPVIAGGKLPAIEGFPEKATRDRAQLRAWFRCSIFDHDHGHNVGIYTGRYGDDPAASLCVIDVDNKGGKGGSAELARLALPLPATYTQRTPTGGLHYVFRTRAPVANSAGKLATGLDIRGTGGFIVGAGSTVDAGTYTADGRAVAEAPAALLALCTAYKARSATSALFDAHTNAPQAIAAAVDYLRAAPIAEQGNGGDAATFAVCARVKDYGVAEPTALALLLEHWNGRCAPPWEADDLAVKVANAYHYGKSPPGIAAPGVAPPFAGSAQAAVAALAALPTIEYESRRKAEAERLGIRASALDAAVREARPAKASSQLDDLFPTAEPWPCAVDGAALLSDIEAEFSHYMTLPAHAAPALALWVLWTYVFDCRDHAPILFASSPTPSCGKSTCMTLVNRMAAKPLMVSNLSAATLFRIIEDWRPTLLIDEADSFAKENEELRGVLNSGHSREGARVLRVEGESGDRQPTVFSTWAPKMLAAIGSLPGTVESRAIIIRLQRRKPGSEAPRLGRRKFDDVRSKATRWAIDNAAAVTAFDCLPPEWLDDRAFDSWQPLMAVAAAAGGGWPEKANESARAISGKGAFDPVAAAGTGVELLRDIRDVFAALGDCEAKLATADLIHRLCLDEGARWCDYFRGQRITPSQVARLLKPFGIASKTIRVQGGATPKGYQLAQFEDAFARYLPSVVAEGAILPPQRHNVATAGVVAAFAGATGSIVLRHDLPPQPNSHKGCGVVAAGTPPMAPQEMKTDLRALFG